MDKTLVQSSKRIFGLDIMRALAVFLVVFGHMLQHAKPPDWLGHFGRLGILGVEIFFVLSGFLIGGIIVDLINKGKFAQPADLLAFWTRRWLRTLPLYYLFLFIYLKFDWNGATRLVDHLEFLVFLQNFAWRPPDFFLLSWSLTIEEYFYFLFPILFYLLLRICRDPVKSLKIAVVVFMLVPLLLKAGRTPYPGWDEFNFNLRMVCMVRLDSLMYGVAAVLVKQYYPRLWSSIKRLTPLWIVLLLAISAYIYINLPGLCDSSAARIIQSLLFPAISLSVALLLPLFDGVRDSKNLYLKDLITYISTISYSMYLSHILVITEINQALSSLPHGMETIEPFPQCLYLLYTVFILAAAPVTYYLWERPFMRLRDRRR
jgi:peptidoglycan/LPS O-acetylase OafA/YrhL